MRQPITVRAIARAVAEVYRLDADDLVIDDTMRGPAGQLLEKREQQCAIEARHVVMFISRRITTRSLRQIAERLGYRDYSAALYGERRIIQRLPREDALRSRIVTALAKIVMAEVEKPLPPATITDADIPLLNEARP